MNELDQEERELRALLVAGLPKVTAPVTLTWDKGVVGMWLPFQPFATFKAGVNGSGSKEVIWTGGLGA